MSDKEYSLIKRDYNTDDYDSDYEELGNTSGDICESSTKRVIKKLLPYERKNHNIPTWLKRLMIFIVVILTLSGGCYAVKYAYEYKMKEERKIKRRKAREARQRINYHIDLSVIRKKMEEEKKHPGTAEREFNERLFKRFEVRDSSRRNKELNNPKEIYIPNQEKERKKIEVSDLLLPSQNE